MIRIITSVIFKRATPFSLAFPFTSRSVDEKSKQIVQSFTDKVREDGKSIPTRGRAWKAEQLRLKSTEDLHKLWYTCVKQKNIVLADKLASRHEVQIQKDTGRLLRVQKIHLTMRRIIFVINQRQNIKKQYRKQLQEQYIQNKKKQLETELASKPEPLPEITWEMLRAKYHDLRKGVDNVRYLERIWQNKSQIQERSRRAQERLSNQDNQAQFTSFWEKEMSIGERPTQEQILRSHVKNWKSLNLKQRKIILGFLNARRAKDAKSTFVKQLRILGQKIAYEQAKDRVNKDKS